jgi:hypothetical protein
VQPDGESLGREEEARRRVRAGARKFDRIHTAFDRWSRPGRGRRLRPPEELEKVVRKYATAASSGRAPTDTGALKEYEDAKAAAGG